MFFAVVWPISMLDYHVAAVHDAIYNTGVWRAYMSGWPLSRTGVLHQRWHITFMHNFVINGFSCTSAEHADLY